MNLAWDLASLRLLVFLRDASLRAIGSDPDIAITASEVVAQMWMHKANILA